MTINAAVTLIQESTGESPTELIGEGTQTPPLPQTSPRLNNQRDECSKEAVSLSVEGSNCLI